MKTQVPGPRSREILELMQRYVPRAMTPHVPAVIARASGAIVEDVDGNQFIDFSGGIGVVNVGHAPPEVVDAVTEQTRRFLHTDFTVVPYEPYVRLAERLARQAPGGPWKVAFFNSGAEAVENAVKLARYATGRAGVIALEGAFHGRTYMAMTLTSKVKPYKERFGPFVPEVYRVPAPYCYRCPLGLRYPDCGLACVESMKRALVTTVAPEAVAAVIVEPVQGEGGFVVPPPEYLPAVRELTARHDILLIVDEIQTGFGRTGRFFAVEHFGVQPDVLTVGKSLAAGLPLSGVIARAELYDRLGESVVGGTFVGNPVACAAGLAVLDIFERQQLVERASRLGELIRQRMMAMQERFAIIGDVRGLGAMMAMELVRDRSTKEPADVETSRILRRCFEQGLIAVKAGIYGNVIRMLVPLVIEEEQLLEGLAILEQAIAQESRA
ncbi:MAG: 4-aminobutyrate--2-oxoglutarate transaminase [Limnochordaceae bacterium]|nr:4-aminobutyrate--2-oxoglutarate transaminase [Limnochordaceae bacterium]